LRIPFHERECTKPCHQIDPPDQLHLPKSLKIFYGLGVDVVGQELLKFIGFMVGDIFDNVCEPLLGIDVV